ncbi:MAG: hypothetical protein V1874_01520 [Spirochaetota bacterium]
MTIKKYLVLFVKILSLIFILPSAFSFAELTQPDFIIKQKKFIHELYQSKRYFDCIAETQRLLAYGDNIKNKNKYIYFMEACYYLGGQYKTVISGLENANSIRKDKPEPANIFLLSHSYLNIGYYRLSKEILDKLEYVELKKDEQTKLFVNRTELLIKNYEFRDILAEIETADKYINRFNNSFALLDFKNDIQRYTEIGLKSKWLSASLSALMPGAGQVYSGKIIDGVLSFTAVVGSAAGAFYFNHKKEKALAITFSFFTCLFYAGNLYGAYNSAENANGILNERFADSINKKYDLYYNPGEYIDMEMFR